MIKNLRIGPRAEKRIFGRLEQDPTSENVDKTLEHIHNEASGKVMFWCVTPLPVDMKTVRLVNRE